MSQCIISIHFLYSSRSIEKKGTRTWCVFLKADKDVDNSVNAEHSIMYHRKTECSNIIANKKWPKDEGRQSGVR